ncbi:glycerophosphodiester phosphodiesterase [Sinomicrobium soli]|uniref:glycerophosphodiester phosphodiesterase n=1 Tax=Sinomicrobium sp. N-1-3-6 TaxID=2219864 RepID=UPI000DCB80CF|nr:glycerophosphodiester phosphodiesterase family protein [Sinomicrobium sp. N-1-3-6]RAV29694.1 glycerophosphodiester phosphodiesterase [Sinomicrobium sp. N-1-3-6]
MNKLTFFLIISMTTAVFSNGALAQNGNDFIRNKVIAHRGAFKNAGLPENSMASLKRAIALGCEGSEFDVWMTADGVLVVNHNADFNGLDIETSTYEQLLQKTHPNGEHIPTAENYIREGLKQHRTRLIFEIKTPADKARGIELAEKSVALVHNTGAREWVDYIAFDYDICKKVMELDPSANVAYLNGDRTPSQLKKDGFSGLDYSIGIMKKHPEWIREARELGLTVNVWTVNKRDDMQWLLGEHADFITTNEPELLLELVKRP